MTDGCRYCGRHIDLSNRHPGECLQSEDALHRERDDDVMRLGTAAEATELRALLRDVVVAADRMRDNWSEGDEAVRKQLWTNLHSAADAAQDEVYPL